jgi:predicted lipoprotein with Yx(FWY)xxD motif
MKLLSLCTAVLAATLAVPAVAQSDAPLHKQNGVLVNAAGMTVYTFDKDSGKKSACSGQCTENWPPVVASTTVLSPPYSTIKRDDGTMQLTYKGKPLYTFAQDKAPGDKKGDKVKNVWHAVTE